jgi:hypothetical protein
MEWEAKVCPAQTRLVNFRQRPRWFVNVSEQQWAEARCTPSTALPWHAVLLQGISDIITVPGLINVDFADVKAIMTNSGTAMLGGSHQSQELVAMVSLFDVRRHANSLLGRCSALHAHRECSLHDSEVPEQRSHGCSDAALCWTRPPIAGQALPGCCWISFVGVGVATGEGRAQQAAQSATAAPLIQRSIERATGELLPRVPCLLPGSGSSFKNAIFKVSRPIPVPQSSL